MNLNLFSYALVCLFLLSCKTGENRIVPYVQVDQTVFLSDPINFNINFAGGWVYLAAGSRGIILYRLDQERFVAFDRHCTYDIDNPNGIVEVDTSQILLSDPSCGSKFIITDGSIYNGPAELPLQQYQTYFDVNANTVRVYN